MKIIKTIWPYLVIVLVVVLIRTFIITPATVDGDSMDPTLKDNEVILVNKIYMKLDKLNRYDIVVVKHNGEYLVKRVVGLPGEHIIYKDNNLIVGNKIITSDLEFEKTNDFEIPYIPENSYFVMGDNRDVSQDSRSFGAVPVTDIVGKVNIVLFPFSRFGLVK